jgi:hypothetical protein
MEITKINAILEQLSSDPKNGRDHILSLARAFIEWMGFEWVENNRPRLLDFGTLKLKEALVPAPITGQEQIYRLTAEGQDIKVRFAVLKKYDKKTIQYIVDNHVGLISYQARMKGVKQIEGREPYISNNPYYLHFIATAKYDRLWVIFNEGEQKRVLVFRNRLSQTQYNKILPVWKNISTKPKPEMVKLLWSALDVKEVNKDFYKHIKEQFDALIGIAKIQTADFEENTTKQFAVRLIGRYIFCWFLKEKEIIPETLISSVTIEKYKDSYFQKLLAKLYFKTLNAEVSNPARYENITELDNLYKNIPYLNGGLFDWHPEDVLFEKLDLNAWLITFVKVLEDFDFTVDESSSQYQQVAIDPEMLGRIFENLLASQNPDTEKMANQRKAFGAFYTPREIVDYMVNESLRSYIETKVMPEIPTNVANEPTTDYSGTLFGVQEPKVGYISLSPEELGRKADAERRRERWKTQLDKLFAIECSDNPLSKDETIEVRKALNEITVLDPACGSGAFPMGVMLRLMELRQIVGHGHRNNYDLKSEILSKNIYGVDIMPMAIEIARLRAWLSLVLEADYKPADRKNNFGIAALPNLDFKFVCANSLIDSGYDEFLAKIKYNQTLYRLDGEIQKLQRIRDDYFDPKGDNHKKEVLQKEFNETKEYIKQQINTGTLKKNYSLENFFEKVDDWNPFDDSHPSSFFSPAWMFGITDGFDVVIGNPPYIGAIALAKELRIFLNNSRDYSTLYQKWDIYIAFIEKSIRLSKNGITCMIIPYPVITQTYAKKLRDFILNENDLLEITNLSGNKIFEEAMVTNCILFVKNGKSKNGNIRLSKLIDSKISIIDNLLKSNLVKDEKTSVWDLSNNKSLSFAGDKFQNLGDYCFISIGMVLNADEKRVKGLFTKDDLLSISETKIYCKKYIEAKHIEKYIIKKNLFLEWGTERVPALIRRPTFPELYEHPKLLVSKIGKIKATLDTSNIYCDQTIRVLVLWNDLKNIKNKSIDNSVKRYQTNSRAVLEQNSIQVELNYLLAILNSKLATYLLDRIRGVGNIDINPEYLKNIPIPKISLDQQLPFITRAEKILSLKKQNHDTTALEKEIDVLVYKLYELTYDEVKIVDKDFWLSEEEYEQTKLS